MKLFFTILLTLFTINLSPQKLIAKKDNVPIIVVPGFMGTLPQFQYFPRFAFTRGVAPYVFEPAQEYEPLLEKLKTSGREVIFAGYDWRIRTVKFDGVIDGKINHSFRKDGIYQTGLDYFLESLALTVLKTNCREVDVIAHSTGGLIARAYIQSNYYNEEIEIDGIKIRLPEIREMIMVSVPNKGTTFAWNPWNGNVSSMKGFTRAGNVFKIIFELVRIGFSKVNGPDYVISSTDVAGVNGVDNFLRMYMPSLIDLLPDYDFVITNNNDTIRELPVNYFLADLNANGDWTDKVSSLYLTSGIDNPTAEYVIRMGGSGGEVYKLNDIENPRQTREYETWYLDLKIVYNGDGVVALNSLIGGLGNYEIVLWSNNEVNDVTEINKTFYSTDHVRLLVNDDFVNWASTILN